MSLDFAVQRPMLDGKWPVTKFAAPDRNGFQSAPQTIPSSFPLNGPASFTGSPPIMGEPQKVEGGFGLALARRLETKHFGLGRMQLQAEACEALRQNGEHPPRVALVAEAQHGVIGKPDEKRPPHKPRFDLTFEPQVKHDMQVEVRQQGRDHASNNLAKTGLLPREM